MTRIAVGGFLHETNTFAPTKATYADFVHGGGWPSMAHGPDVLEVMKKINVGLAGFAQQAAAIVGFSSQPLASAASTKPARPTLILRMTLSTSAPCVIDGQPPP